MKKRNIKEIIAIILITLIAVYAIVQIVINLTDSEDEALQESQETETCYDRYELFATPAEAIARAEIIGCSGYHTHSAETGNQHMACENHDQDVNMDVIC